MGLSEHRVHYFCADHLLSHQHVNHLFQANPSCCLYSPHIPIIISLCPQQFIINMFIQHPILYQLSMLLVSVYPPSRLVYIPQQAVFMCLRVPPICFTTAQAVGLPRALSQGQPVAGRSKRCPRGWDLHLWSVESSNPQRPGCSKENSVLKQQLSGNMPEDGI